MRKVLLTSAVVVVLAAGYATADAEDWVPGFLTLTPATAASAPTPSPSSGPTPGATASTDASGWPVTSAAASVLGAPNPSAPMPTKAALTRLLTVPLGQLGASGSGEVIDVASGRILYSHRASTPHTPASTTKVLSGLSALVGLGPQTRLTTKVVDGTTVGQVVLVGGGDIRLATGAGSSTAIYGHAGLGDLASATASALKSAGRQQVSLGFDDSLFSGPTSSSHWVPSDSTSGMVGPVTALGMAAKAPVENHRRAPKDPSLATAQAFAADLVRLGITVTGVPRRVKAASGTTELAAVQSATVEQLVDYTLTVSDNTEAEVLARLGARAGGKPGSFAGAAEQNIRVAATLGAPVTGMRLYDGSGLARADLIPAHVLTTVLTKAAASDRPELRALFAGLPIAALTGTLAPRFVDASTRGGAGLVRAKTGTLAGVNTLAGVVVDAEGRLLAFAFMFDHPTAKTPPALPLIDRAAAVLAGCGCR